MLTLPKETCAPSCAHSEALNSSNMYFTVFPSVNDAHSWKMRMCTRVCFAGIFFHGLNVMTFGSYSRILHDYNGSTMRFHVLKHVIVMSISGLGRFLKSKKMSPFKKAGTPCHIINTPPRPTNQWEWIGEQMVPTPFYVYACSSHDVLRVFICVQLTWNPEFSKRNIWESNDWGRTE